MTDMDKIQKDNAEPGKAPDKMSADKRKHSINSPFHSKNVILLL
jgi:hypothetical protein